ncbi:MAG: ROK family protein [Planctomycetota bacterium]
MPLEPPHKSAPPTAWAAMLRSLLEAGPASRAELHRRTGLRPNTVGQTIDAMVSARWVREAGTAHANQRLGGEGRGRPATLVEVDDRSRDVIGLALMPGELQAVRLSLTGEPLGRPVTRRVRRAPALIEAGAEAIGELMKKRTLAVGVSSPGLLDESAMRLLFSSVAHEAGGVSLHPLVEAARPRPMAFENDVHAIADWWRLSQPHAAGETTLLVRLGDGAIGASLMPGGGESDPGCVRGANELGHTQVGLEAFASAAAPRPAVCFCGQPRCIERVFSSDMIHRLDGSRRRLPSALRRWAAQAQAHPDGPPDSPERWIVERLAEASANVINFSRPRRVVWVGAGPMAAVMPVLSAPLEAAVHARLLPALRERVAMSCWSAKETGAFSDAAIAAGHLALALLTGRRAPALQGQEIAANGSGQPSGHVA